MISFINLLCLICMYIWIHSNKKHGGSSDGSSSESEGESKPTAAAASTVVAKEVKEEKAVYGAAPAPQSHHDYGKRERSRSRSVGRDNRDSRYGDGQDSDRRNQHHQRRDDSRDRRDRHGMDERDKRVPNNRDRYAGGNRDRNNSRDRYAGEDRGRDNRDRRDYWSAGGRDSREDRSRDDYKSREGERGRPVRDDIASSRQQQRSRSMSPAQSSSMKPSSTEELPSANPYKRSRRSRSRSPSPEKKKYGLLPGRNAAPKPSSSGDATHLGPNPELLRRKQEAERKAETDRRNRTRADVSSLTEEERLRRIEAMQADADLNDAQRASRLRNSQRPGAEDTQSGNAEFLQSMRKEVYTTGSTDMGKRIDQNKYSRQSAADIDSADGFVRK